MRAKQIWLFGILLSVNTSNLAGQAIDDLSKLDMRTLTQGAEAGNPAAQNALGIRYLNGEGTQRDDAQATAWFRRAADQGYAAGEDYLGIVYQLGRGIQQDYAQAIAWYSKAADQGYAAAQYNLGYMYENGLGVQQDDAQAVAWYRKAADQGDASAQNTVGVMYQLGRGVQQDNYQAVAWFSKAASQEFSTAQYDLGYMYQNGLGVQRDYAQAIAWYRKAANQGYAAAKLRLAALNVPPTAQMSQAQNRASAQTKIDIDASDIAAFQQELSAAQTRKLPHLHFKNNYSWNNCKKNNYYTDENLQTDTRNSCFDVVRYNGDSLSASDKEAILLRGCSYPDHYVRGAITNPCLSLGQLYEADGQYIRAALVYSSNSCAQNTWSATISCLSGLRKAFDALGNTAAEYAVARSLCFNAYSVDTCRELQQAGIQVDLVSIEHQAVQAENDQTHRHDTNSPIGGDDGSYKQPSWLSALSAVATAVQPSASSSTAPVYSGQQTSTVSTPSASSPSGGQSSGSCRDMSACIKVVSSSYGNQAGSNRFLHVVVKNVCGETVVAMVSVKAQNRSCTTSQSANLAPGETEDMGAMTDLNHYSILASDNIFLSNGMYRYPNGCSIQPTDCDGR